MDASSESTMASGQPVRLQIRRTKGFRLQESSLRINSRLAVKVDRCSPFGNPFEIGTLGRTGAVEAFRRLISGDMSEAELRGHSESLGRHDDGHYLRSVCNNIRLNIGSLRGKNLACWCRLDWPCHGDVLLQFADSQELDVDQTRQLRFLEEENSRLKRLVADLTYEKQVLQGAAKGLP